MRIYDVTEIRLSQGVVPIEGKFPLPIDSQEYKTHWEEKYQIELPDCDYSVKSQYISFGRKIASARYRVISKYFWNYHDTFIGEFTFEHEAFPNSIFIYETNRVLLKPDDRWSE
ncbi:MAG: hypothetical protein CSA81_01890 [Acidobacteria bacterium]|nr:MAG: hypothetical protein CSA81_01890 [Acidobacteriota bacterium]